MTSTETTTNANTADKAANVAAQGAHVAPDKAASKKEASQKKGAPKAKKAAKGAKAKATAPKKGAKDEKAGKRAGKRAAKPAAKHAPAKKANTPRAESKTAKVLEMIGGAKGATLAEIMKATGWQPHSVRGFISGALGKKMGLTVESTKNPTGERVYRLAK